MYADVPMFLAVEFKGYEDDDGNDPDKGGKPINISGPYIFELKIAKVSIAIDDTGSIYEFECPIGASEAYADFNFKVPKDMYVQGKTIEQMTQNLEDNIKKFKEDNLKEELIHDEIVFDLSQLKNELGNTSLVDGSNRDNRNAAEQVNRLINAESKGIKTKEDFDKALEDNPESLDGGITVESAGWGTEQQINIKEGTSMNQFFTTMLVMNDSFLDSISRKKAFRDPVIDESGLDLNQTFTKWYKIEAHIEYLEFDERRNKYAKKITYTPIIYETRNDKATISVGEEKSNEEQVKRHVQNLKIKKAYHYLYTGLNDQVLSADIQYNAGQVLLAPPGAGKLGDLSQNPNSPSANIPPDKDLSGLDDKAKIAAAQSDFDRQIKNGNFRDQLQQDLGYDNKQMKEFLEDKERRNAAARAIAFTNYGKQPTGNQTSGSSGTQDIDTSYKPEGSGYIYSADLIDDEGGSEIIIGELSSYAQKQRAKNSTTAVKNAADSGENSVEPKESVMFGPSIVSTSGDTSDGTPAATLFGYMYNNINDTSILIDLGLKVRGDPYFLGQQISYLDARKPTKKMSGLEEYNQQEEKKEEGMVYNSNSDNFFLFTMQTPRVRDPDYTDEDANTGYMSQAGTAYFISGIYRIVSVSCNFNGGMFTVDFDKAPKLTSVPLSKFKLTGDGVNYGGGND